MAAVAATTAAAAAAATTPTTAAAAADVYHRGFQGSPFYFDVRESLIVSECLKDY